MTAYELAESLAQELEAEVPRATSRIQHIQATRHALQARALANLLAHAQHASATA